MGLPERHRIVLVLRDIEGLSYEEMAQALSCTVSSVKNRLHRARKLFRERLDPYVKADEV
jgi:RNA polymerase sigma-70 factor (ECF subfamily)